MMDDPERDKWPQRVLAYLNHERRRCTYGALGDILGVPARFVARLYLGERRPYVSWVVNKKSRLPTEIKEHDKHPDLESNPAVICDPETLCKLVNEYWHGVGRSMASIPSCTGQATE